MNVTWCHSLMISMSRGISFFVCLKGEIVFVRLTRRWPTFHCSFIHKIHLFIYYYDFREGGGVWWCCCGWKRKKLTGRNNPDATAKKKTNKKKERISLLFMTTKKEQWGEFSLCWCFQTSFVFMYNNQIHFTNKNSKKFKKKKMGSTICHWPTVLFNCPRLKKKKRFVVNS